MLLLYQSLKSPSLIAPSEDSVLFFFFFHFARSDDAEQMSIFLLRQSKYIMMKLPEGYTDIFCAFLTDFEFKVRQMRSN